VQECGKAWNLECGYRLSALGEAFGKLKFWILQQGKIQGPSVDFSKVLAPSLLPKQVPIGDWIKVMLGATKLASVEQQEKALSLITQDVVSGEEVRMPVHQDDDDQKLEALDGFIPSEIMRYRKLESRDTSDGTQGSYDDVQAKSMVVKLPAQTSLEEAQDKLQEVLLEMAYVQCIDSNRLGDANPKILLSQRPD